MKRMYALLFAALLVAGMVPAAAAVDTSASSMVLMDAASGRVLCQSNAHERRPIASITKLMTALVALESGHDLEEEVTIDPAWTGVEGSSLYLRAGETITLKALLYGLLLRSGNDAAIAVAGYCAGSVEAFVGRMNEKAAQLGMENSHFANPNGLDEEGHYSTAYDMALLGQACLQQEQLREMMATKSITFDQRVMTNHNKLLWRYDGCIGMKTGYTEKSGRTLVSAAERDGLTLVCVTLNDPNDWADHTALFDFGFETYRAEQQLQAGQRMGYLPVVNSLVPVCPIVAQCDAVLCVGAGEQVSQELILTKEVLEAPVPAGTAVGEVVIRVDGVECARVSLVTGQHLPDSLAPHQGFLGWWFQTLAG